VGEQPVAPPFFRVAAPLGLWLRQDAATPGAAAKLVTRFAVDALPANGLAGVSKAQKDNLDPLVLDAGKDGAGIIGRVFADENLLSPAIGRKASAAFYSQWPCCRSPNTVQLHLQRPLRCGVLKRTRAPPVRSTTD
jgi:hypothetical protein